MIVNFAVVDARLFRSGQPVTRDEWEWAKRQGVGAVLALNGSDDALAREVGLTCVSIPIGDDEAQSELRDPSVLDKVDACIDAWSNGLLVHCTEGKDRTGIAIARYRVRRCGWTKDAALGEWNALGSHRYRGLLTAWGAWQPR